MTVTHRTLDIDWLGYATVRLEAADTVVYVDPGRYGVLTGDWTADSPAAAAAHPPGKNVSPGDADLVCVSHVHHYDPDAIERVASEGATILTFEGIDVSRSPRDLPRLADLPRTVDSSLDVRTVGLEAEGIAADVPFWTVPAYNERDGPHTRADGRPIHPRGRGCGFILSLDGIRVFWPGDTDVLDGHAALDVGVFCPPIGGVFTMDRTAAADLAAAMDPDLVVPVHYNTFERIETDSQAFVSDLEAAGVPVALDES